MKIFVCSRFPDFVKKLTDAMPDIDFYDACGIPTQTPFIDAKIPKEHEEELLNSELIIADFNLIGPYLNRLKKAKWVQGTWAGLDFVLRYINSDDPPTFQVTRYSGKDMSRQLLEYTIANIINYERNFYKLYIQQKQKSTVQFGTYSAYTTLPDLAIGILGVGAIGSIIATELEKLGAKVLTYGRSERNQVGYFTRATLPQLLQSCDYLVNVLPNTPETQGLLNGEILQNCKGRTVFVNIGRGTVIAERDLVKALENKWLRGAILDVFEKEPLALDSPLWDMDQVILTPHVAGRPTVEGLVQLVKENISLYLENKPLQYLVDFKKSY